jgi:hypothetical protein
VKDIQTTSPRFGQYAADSLEQVFEPVLRLRMWIDYDLPVVNRKINPGSARNVRLLHECLRDTHGQTVSPLLNRRLHGLSPVSTKKIHPDGAANKVFLRADVT